VPTPPGIWIRLSVRYPQNRKIRPLTDAAFRLHIELLCWAKDEATGGLIDADNLDLFGRPKARAELIRRGLLEDAGGGDWALHDFEDWQETTTADQTRRVRSRVGSVGNHERWHVARGVKADGCDLCHPIP